MDNYRIIKAEREHIESVCKLYHELFIDMSVQQPEYYHTGTITQSAVKRFIDNSAEGALFIAVNSDDVIGFVYVMK